MWEIPLAFSLVVMGGLALLACWLNRDAFDDPELRHLRGIWFGTVGVGLAAFGLAGALVL